VNTNCPHAGSDTIAIIACSDYKAANTVTNYEFIQSMSMDRMAEMLTSGHYSFDCKECWELNGWTSGRHCDWRCKDYCLQWLGRPFDSEERLALLNDRKTINKSEE
jgi:hypothetical protein